MLIIQGLALYQLFSPFYLWPPKINLPKELDESEPLEYEINLDPGNLDPGPMGPKPITKPAESAPNSPNSAESAVAQTQPAAASSSAPTTPAASPPSLEQSSPAPPIPEQPIPKQPSPAQTAAAVLSIAHSTPAPQPLLAVEATPAASAPDIVLMPSLDVAAASTTEQPAEERGAPGGAANSDAVSTPVRPLALEANAAPDRIAAAPISILPGVQALNVEPVIAATPVTTADRAVDRIPVDLTIADEKPVFEKPMLSQIAVPAPAVDVTLPMRVKPQNPKPDLSVEQAKPRVAKPVIPAAAVRPVLSRADASANPASTTTPDLRVDADATPNIAAPAAPAAAARPVLSPAPAKVSASESTRLEVARDEIGRPTMPVQEPIAASDTPASDRSTAQSRDSDRSASNASNVGASTAQNLSTPSQSTGASAALAARPASTSALPSDPFARAGSGRGPRDLLGQGADAAAAQVGANADAYPRGNAFRRYHDPFADDAPNPLAGLRLREPQMFSDVSRFLVKTFGPAALGFAVGASNEIDDFSGPNAGILIEQWIQQHHGDLQRECRLRQETMDEHIRRLLCGEP